MPYIMYFAESLNKLKHLWKIVEISHISYFLNMKNSEFYAYAHFQV